MRTARILIAASLILAVITTPAIAHTKLLTSDPAAGSLVESWPTEISLTFDEDLINIGDEKSNFLVVNNAVGDQISADDEVINWFTN
jgi:copper resistance protein C